MAIVQDYFLNAEDLVCMDTACGAASACHMAAALLSRDEPAHHGPYGEAWGMFEASLKHGWIPRMQSNNLQCQPSHGTK